MKRLSLAVLAIGALVLSGSPAAAAQACAGLDCVASSVKLMSCHDGGGAQCPICQRVEEPVRGYVCSP